ncbi:MAG: aminofutalosine synthase MqnE [Bacteroidia bacterium]|nr:aminofutalosine synthase MqnE [Bacteroidia bacterium]
MNTSKSEYFLKNLDLLSSGNELKEISAKVFNGTRITTDDAMYLFEHANLAELGYLANYVREQKNGNNTFFNRNFHIEPTNVCIFTCKFCSYSRLYKNKEAGWELSIDEMLDMVKAYDGKPVTEVHIVGGVHPKMDINFFGSLLEQIKTHRPELHIKAFTAVELDYMFNKAKMSIKEGLQFLKDKGLDSLPGGGAEIFDEKVRLEIAGDKCSSEKWLKIHETAHDLGIKSNVTMLYGHIENNEHRVDHLNRVRNLQDKTGGFNTFIPLKFRNDNNDMSHVSESNLIEDLKTYAVSRIFLDNVNHVKAYWPMIGRSTAQLSMAFGVDDIDGTIDDSTKIYSMAGAEEQTPVLNTKQLVRLIEEAGRVPIERGTLYNEIRNYSENPIEEGEVSATLNS